MSAPYRVLVTGSRNWADAAAIGAALEQTLIDVGPRTVLVVHGACPTGADRMADDYTLGRRGMGCNIDVERHPADWARHGKAAGFRRNADMVNLGAHICLAFIRNSSRGATHTANLADRAGIPVRLWTA